MRPSGSQQQSAASWMKFVGRSVFADAPSASVSKSRQALPGLAPRRIRAHEEDAASVPVEVHRVDRARVLVELALGWLLAAEAGEDDQRCGPVPIYDEVVVAREIRLRRMGVPARIAAAVLHGEDGKVTYERMRGQETALARKQRLRGRVISGSERLANGLLLVLDRRGKRPHGGNVIRVGAGHLGPVVRQAFQRIGVHQAHLRGTFLKHVLRRALHINGHQRGNCCNN